MKLLFFQWNAFMQRGIENAMKRLKISYETYRYIFQDWDQDEHFLERFAEKIRQGGYDLVFSVNFSPLIAEVCHAFKLPYISWVYDCPLHIRRTDTLAYKENTVYFFDRAQAEQYRRQGIDTARHLPLAADPSVFFGQAPEAGDNYDCDVSLVGQLYRSDYSYLCGPLTPYRKGFLEGFVKAQMQLAGGYVLGELVTPGLVKELNKTYAQASGGSFQIQPAELEYALACEATGRARYMALALLQERCSVRLYSADQDPRLTKVRHGGYVDYYTQMPAVFRNSRVNLNLSLCAIASGIPLRVLDILGCGGFVLTDYRPELTEYFEPGRDLVIYEDLKDLVYKAQYYLAHEEERREIAARGNRIVKEAFSFDDRLRKMIPGAVKL